MFLKKSKLLHCDVVKGEAFNGDTYRNGRLPLIFHSKQKISQHHLGVTDDPILDHLQYPDDRGSCLLG
jgi:hypothetical protein